MGSDYKEELQEALAYIRRQYSEAPEVGIILGTGLGGLVDKMEIDKIIPYNFIPNFPISTVESHFGKLIFGRLEGKRVMAMQGRFHYYEGYSMKQITFPVRIMKMMGVKNLMISNACGGLNLDYQNGDLMIIDDHINLQPDNPLIGPNDPDFGPRFPDMSRPYDPEMIDFVYNKGKEKGYRVQKGVYVAVTGPSLETRAEYRFLRNIGADVVGMSTVPEVIVANQMGMRTFALSVITDMCDPDDLEKITIESVIAIANEAEPRMTELMAELIKFLEIQS